MRFEVAVLIEAICATIGMLSFVDFVMLGNQFIGDLAIGFSGIGFGIYIGLKTVIQTAEEKTKQESQ
jgi:hypothetical protein